MSRVISILICLASTSVWAGKPSVAVLDIQGTGIETTLLPTLTEVLTVEVDNLGSYKVIAGRDVQAMLGFEKQKDVAGCTDAACLAEIGGALGVDRIVASHIGKVGRTFVVNIKLINIRMADTEARVYETVRGEVDDLIQTVRKSVVKLLGGGSKAAESLGVAKATPKRAPEPKAAPQPAPKPQVTQAPVAPPPPTVAKSGGRKLGWLPISLMSTGGAGLALGAVFGLRAKNLEEEAHRQAPDGVYEPGTQVAAEDARTSQALANVSYTVGLLAAGSGVLVWLLSGSGDAPTTAMVPVVGPESVGVAFSGQF